MYNYIPSPKLRKESASKLSSIITKYWDSIYQKKECLLKSSDSSLDSSTCRLVVFFFYKRYMHGKYMCATASTYITSIQYHIHVNNYLPLSY